MEMLLLSLLRLKEDLFASNKSQAVPQDAKHIALYLTCLDSFWPVVMVTMMSEMLR